MKTPRWLIFVSSLLLFSGEGYADGLLSMRSKMPFNQTYESLKGSMAAYGYNVAHTQTCNLGMEKFGYKSDNYYVVFFGKREEVEALIRDYPDMAPFVPLKVALFAENDETVLVTVDPPTLSVETTRPDLDVQLQRWHNDIVAIFDELEKGV